MLLACSAETSTSTSTSTSTNASAPLTCGPLVPSAACRAAKKLGVHGPLNVCADASQRRVGRWDYALIAPHYTISQNVSSAFLRALWNGQNQQQLAVAPATERILKKRWGPPSATVRVETNPRPHPGKVPRWAIIEAHELTPAWKPIRVDGTFALDRDDKSPLAISLCAPGTATGLRNILPDKTTLLTMTGVTAMSRLTGELMDAKGVTYPAKNVADWFRDSDFVHVSNEVSFKAECKHRKRDNVFCSKDEYIGLLEAIGANIIELTGSHLTDYGRKQVLRTLEMYRSRGWRWFGGGKNQEEATRPLRIEHNGNRIAMLGCNLPRTENGFMRDLPGEGLCDYGRMRWQVRELRRQGYLPIVSIQHWEENQYRAPRRLIREFRPFAEAGAVMVFGSQAHQPHPFEIHYGAFIHYGPGNLFFDMMTSLGTRQGVVDRLYFHDGKLLSIEKRFTLIREGGRPVPMTTPQRKRLLDTLAHAAKRIWPKAKPNGTPKLSTHLRGRPATFLSRDGKFIVPYVVSMPKQAARGLMVQLQGERPQDRGQPFVTVSPRGKHTRRWRSERIAEFIEHLTDTYGIDKRRVYMTGKKGSAGERFCLTAKQRCRFVNQPD